MLPNHHVWTIDDNNAVVSSLIKFLSENIRGDYRFMAENGKNAEKQRGNAVKKQGKKTVKTP